MKIDLSNVTGKLKMRTEEEVTSKEMILAAILAIQSGDNPRIVRQKLMSFVDPHVRTSVAPEGEE